MIGTLGQRLAAVTPDGANAAQMARGLFAHMVGREAQTLAFDDIFRTCWRGSSSPRWCWCRSAARPPMPSPVSPELAH